MTPTSKYIIAKLVSEETASVSGFTIANTNDNKFTVIHEGECANLNGKTIFAHEAKLLEGTTFAIKYEDILAIVA